MSSTSLLTRVVFRPLRHMAATPFHFAGALTGGKGALHTADTFLFKGVTVAEGLTGSLAGQKGILRKLGCRLSAYTTASVVTVKNLCQGGANLLTAPLKTLKQVAINTYHAFGTLIHRIKGIFGKESAHLAANTTTTTAASTPGNVINVVVE